MGYNSFGCNHPNHHCTFASCRQHLERFENFQPAANGCTILSTNEHVFKEWPAHHDKSQPATQEKLEKENLPLALQLDDIKLLMCLTILLFLRLT